ncbi:hypothetical protein ACQ4PT_062295 [Festuca glaucescens]
MYMDDGGEGSRPVPEEREEAASAMKRGRPPRPGESDFVTGEEEERLAPQRTKRKREASAAAAAAAEDLTLIGKAFAAPCFCRLGFVCAVSGNLPLGFGRSAAVYKELKLCSRCDLSWDLRLISHAVKRLVEDYESDPKSVIFQILTMLFEASGAKHDIAAKDLDMADLDDIVLKLVDLSRNGLVQDKYNSKRKDLKNFKENLVSFWDTLVLECQNGPLFDDILLQKIKDYVVALSCTPPRVYRQVASLIGLQLVTSFIFVAKTLSAQREITQRQLNAEKKKQSDGPAVESLNKRLSVTHENITYLEELMRKIFNG